MSTNPPKLLPPELEPLRTELATYHKELPRWLEEGEQGKYVVIKGETVHNVWDTSRDAEQYALEKFGLDEQFLLQQIDERFIDLMATIFGPHPEPDPEGA